MLLCGDTAFNEETIDKMQEPGAILPPLIPAGAVLYRCNRLRCPLARMSGLQCFNMGHNGHGINLYGVSMTLIGN